MELNSFFFQNKMCMFVLCHCRQGNVKGCVGIHKKIIFFLRNLSRVYSQLSKAKTLYYIYAHLEAKFK